MITPALGVAALLAVCTLGWVAADTYLPGGGQIVQAAHAAPAVAERRVHFSMCGRNRHTCIVDGDTIWLDGQNLRLQSYDTPEPYNDICGGQAEVALAHRASARLLDLLNANSFTVQTSGQDRYGRVLATIRIGGRDVGDILIEEGLARRWPDGHEWWCE
ncbi:thermonuclease family protein [Devosia sp. YIM 151766]|uniref:thermonuclease family protein n=1 Tax=Devosia sp. YIM 151766 TaxID=3017325 RepID=UPI00255CF7B9|nr:thermonuclease family protein [Devosia sp. YIM 151766]WIY54173.1 thermonuclease family protein [Devosia sp. YIM 151766]